VRHALCEMPAATVIPIAGSTLIDMATARLGSIALDCESPAELANFWSELLGGEIAFTSDTFVAVKTDRVWLAAVHVEDYQPPTWPGGDAPKQMHLDLAVDDLDQSEAAAIRLGAVRGANQPAPDRFRVLLDPAGHPFCLSTQIPE
jgi:Glyoxalase-like domain